MNRVLIILLTLGFLLVFSACNDGVEGDAPGECDDGTDNDQDGMTDCDDSGCAADDACASGDDDDSAGDDDDSAGDDDDTTVDDDDTTDDDDHSMDDDDTVDDDDTTGDDDSSGGPLGTIGGDCLGPVTYLPLECATVAGDTLCYDPAFDRTWQWSPPVEHFDWSNAVAYCESLTFGLGTDWNAPTICEARSIIRNCPATEFGGVCGVSDACVDYTCWTSVCSNCPVSACAWPPELTGGCSDDYWTGVQVLGTDLTSWFVGYYTGGVHHSPETTLKRVRCVHVGDLRP